MKIPGAVALVVLAVGCGGGGGTATVTLADFGARIAAAQCGRVFRCCSTEQVQALYGSSVSDESTCVAKLTQLGQLVATQLGQQQTASRLRYDGRAAAACFANMGNAACTAASNDWSGIPNCDAYVVPLVATGGACDGDEECQTGFCDRPLTSAGDGTCVVVPSRGMPCTSRCVAGATCDTVAGTCADPKADGAFCFVDEDCLSGNCDNPNITGGTCVAATGPTCGPAT